MTDMYNRDVILSMPGQLYSFESIDEGEEKYLNTMLAPKTLWLKENAKCILLRNLSDSLVNGLQGKVLKIREGSVDVYFPSLNEVTTLSRVNFTVFDPDSCRNLASRYQIPLKLSYAITVHKAQGRTLESTTSGISGIPLPVPDDIRGLYSQRNDAGRMKDDPKQHAGRVRSFPHQDGNWATSVFAKYCEWGFSTLSRVKTKLRRRINNSTLNSLLMISMKGPDVLKFDFSKAVSTWVQGEKRLLKV